MRILILGGDGYIGWPLALFLSVNGYEVSIMDNFMRRNSDIKFGFDSIVPIFPLYERIERWKEVSGKAISFHLGDTQNYSVLSGILEEYKPNAIVHLAEQRSAPFSMMDQEHAIYTMQNNVLGTLNLLFAIKKHVPNCHLVKLGTMGEYGTPNIDIEEGFITIKHNGREDLLPFPKQPGSFYHLSKVHDSNNIMFACKTWNIRSTDLNQGVVYGVQTDETKANEKLATRYDYDQLYGTALNRFCAQAAVGFPLTVYGKGGQTRSYINLIDSLKCIEIAINTPPKEGEYRVFNQFTQIFSINELASLVVQAGKNLSITTIQDNIENPRVESESHYYNAKNTSLLDLGLEPITLNNSIIESLIKIAVKNSHRLNKDLITPTVNWRYIENKVS